VAADARGTCAHARTAPRIGSRSAADGGVCGGQSLWACTAPVVQPDATGHEGGAGGGRYHGVVRRHGQVEVDGVGAVGSGPRAVDACTTADTGHWIQRIEAKLAKPLAEAAAPEALVGRVVHKPAAAFGRGGEGMLAGLVTGYNADRLTWGVDYDDEARQGPEGLGAADMRLYGPEVDAGDAGDVAHRAVWREYLRSHGGRVRAWYLSGPPAMARWHVNARTNGGLAGSYGRMGLAGRVHCSTYAGTAETTMHTYLHCLPAALRAPSAAPSSGRGCMCQ
jgi:hypothetical protein